MGQDDALGLPPGLREDYLQNARDRLGEIAELAERLVAAGDDAAALDELRSAAHKIRGSAGSFGFAQASAVAGELEETVKAWLAQPGVGAASRGPAARAFVRRLAAALLTRQPPAEAVPPAPDLTPPEPPVQPSDVPEIIVVDGDAAFAERLTFGLEARGYRFVYFRNGAEAVGALRALRTRASAPVLLVDWDHPASGGAAIVATLEQECAGKFRVVLMTARPGEATRSRDWLSKPANLNATLEKIRGWVGR